MRNSRISILRQWGESAGFQTAPASGGLVWSREGQAHVRFRFLCEDDPVRSSSPAPEAQDDAPLTVWVGDETDEERCETGPNDFFLNASALTDAEQDAPNVLVYSRARDERMKVVEAEYLPSKAGDQCILALESPRLARDLRPGQFVNIAISGGPLTPGYRIVNGCEDGENSPAIQSERHHLARVPLSMLRVYREGSRLPSGVGPLPPEMAYRLRPARADRVSVAVRDVGTGTRALCRARVGDELQVLGPLGLPERVPDGVRRVVLLGGGVGFAPLYAIAEQLHWRRIPTTFLAGARVQEHLFPWPGAPGRFVAPEFHGLDLRLLSVTEERDGQYATDLLADHLASEEGGDTDLIYVCGPSPMMARAAAIAEGYGIPCRVFLEKRMECSIGVCMSCVVSYRRDDGAWANVRVCREGTVFDASRVRW